MRRPACQQELHKGRDEVYWQRTGAAQLAENTCLPICFQPGQELWCCKGCNANVRGGKDTHMQLAAVEHLPLGSGHHVDSR